MSQSKIVATIGPITANAESLEALAQAGMDIARLNGSHADLDWHASTIALIRQTLPNVPILLDIPGRKIRTTLLKREMQFEAGDIVVLTTDASYSKFDKVPVNYSFLHQDLVPGQIIHADDGTLRFTVISIEGTDIHCRAEAPGVLKSRKGINVPGARMSGPLITDRDRVMLAFAKSHQVDFIGISFVESSDHVNMVRNILARSSPRIVAKIENRGGVENMLDIIKAADAIMIDRGDLSVETSVEDVAILQKRILEVATTEAKPVIVATEMLHSMIENPFPTKAEVSDIANAVLDRCAATMLSGETAVGKYPIEAVSTMRRIANSAVSHVQQKLDDSLKARSQKVSEVMEDAIAMICRSISVTKIVAITRSGYAARILAARQPRQPILAVSDDASAARSFNLLSGTTGICVGIPFEQTSTDHIPKCLEVLWRRGYVASDDLILVTAVGYPRSGNRMNLIEMHVVKDLVEALAWTN